MDGKTAGAATLTIHPYLMSNLRTDGAIPLFPPYVLTVRCLFNFLKPNEIYICRTAALTSRRYILNIYSTNIHTEYFKHAA